MTNEFVLKNNNLTFQTLIWTFYPKSSAVKVGFISKLYSVFKRIRRETFGTVGVLDSFSRESEIFVVKCEMKSDHDENPVNINIYPDISTILSTLELLIV